MPKKCTCFYDAISGRILHRCAGCISAGKNVEFYGDKPQCCCLYEAHSNRILHRCEGCVADGVNIEFHGDKPRKIKLTPIVIKKFDKETRVQGVH